MHEFLIKKAGVVVGMSVVGTPDQMVAAAGYTVDDDPAAVAAYNASQAALDQAGHDLVAITWPAEQAVLDAASCQDRKVAYNELIVLGVSPASASLMSGWHVGDC